MANLGQSCLFLDDSDERGGKFLSAFPAARWVRTVDDAIEHIRSGRYNEVFLDYDLLSDEKGVDFDDPSTGMAVVRWIVANRPRLESVCIHSHNAPAASQMIIELKSAGYEAFYAPFGRSQFWIKNRISQ